MTTNTMKAFYKLTKGGIKIPPTIHEMAIEIHEMAIEILRDCLINWPIDLLPVLASYYSPWCSTSAYPHERSSVAPSFDVTIRETDCMSREMIRFIDPVFAHLQWQVCLNRPDLTILVALKDQPDTTAIEEKIDRIENNNFPCNTSPFNVIIGAQVYANVSIESLDPNCKSQTKNANDKVISHEYTTIDEPRSFPITLSNDNEHLYHWRFKFSWLESNQLLKFKITINHFKLPHFSF